ncbi:MAG: hypothetical protein AAGD92_15890 [Pseudomonadota bacterium]
MKALLSAAACAAGFLTLSVSHADEVETGFGYFFNTTVQSEPLVFIDGRSGENNGAGVLTRDHDSLRIALHLSELDPNTYYTVWWSVFNNSGRCTESPCALPGDIIAGAGQSINAGGFISGEDGVANVSYELPRGSIPSGLDRGSRFVPIIDPDFEVGLRRPFRSEIQMVIRRHGPVGSGDPVGQLTLFDGGCPGFPEFSGCQDQQLVIFDPIRRRRH